jgi:uncharacterized membrane protein YfcA
MLPAPAHPTQTPAVDGPAQTTTEGKPKSEAGALKRKKIILRVVSSAREPTDSPRYNVAAVEHALNASKPPDDGPSYAAVRASESARDYDDDNNSVAMSRCSCCAGLIEGQYVEPRKPDPTPKQIDQRSALSKLLPMWLWRECVYHRPQKVGFMLPFAWTLAWWLPVQLVTGSLPNYVEEDEDVDALVGWPFALMMLFGSLVAGGTSEGGGAVAYPVMTLVFGLTSYVARDFSLQIQSVGMTAAAFSILYSEIKVEMNAVKWTNLGGVVGCIFGMIFIAPILSGDNAKMLFVGVWSTFAFALWLLNRNDERPVFLDIPGPFTPLKRNVLVAVGFVGGIFTSIAGSGIDIMSFSALTLMFRVSEKTATPTSVILMGCNTVVGFLTQLVIAPYVLSDDVQEKMVPQDGVLCRSPLEGGCIAAQTWRYFLCAAIVVPAGAPMGAYLASFLKREVYAYVVYVFNALQLVGAFLIVSQTSVTLMVFAGSVGLAGLIFYVFSRVGERWLDVALNSGAVPFKEKSLTDNNIEVLVKANEPSPEKGAPRATVGPLFFKTDGILKDEELRKLEDFRVEYRGWRVKGAKGARGQLTGQSSILEGTFSSAAEEKKATGGPADEETCCICLGELRCPVMISCEGQHVFCYECLQRASSASATKSCPLCRKPVVSLDPSKHKVDLPRMVEMSKRRSKNKKDAEPEAK